jgi:clan AA aspartic protease (TIGR02281 family)
MDFERRLEEAPADPNADTAAARVLTAMTATWSIAGVDKTHAIRVAAEAGAFVVPVVINGEIALKFVVDSGATDVSIPADVVSTLIRTGSLKPTDITGEREYELADGSRMLLKTFTIRSLRVGDVVVDNVRATISPPQGAILLGQSFLRRFSSWSIDNANELLVLK